jgi:hypothetical protein
MVPAGLLQVKTGVIASDDDMHRLLDSGHGSVFSWKKPGGRTMGPCHKQGAPIILSFVLGLIGIDIDFGIEIDFLLLKDSKRPVPRAQMSSDFRFR